jgi:cytochrome c553
MIAFNIVKNNRMRFVIGTVCTFLFAVSASTAEGPPTWAYGTEPVATVPRDGRPPQTPSDSSPKHLPGSTLAFTRAQIGDRFGPADWYPGDHPPMPDVVAHGRKPAVWACSLCHYPNGKGRPENAGISGLPAEYFIHQMNDFRDGLRKTADPRKTNTNLMSMIAKAMTDEEIKVAADYFSSMKWTPWIKVVETETVPKTRLSVGMFLPLDNGEKEALGRRIIEMPEQPEATEALRDPRSGFIAYAPVGSIKKGEQLVTTGSGKMVACGVCHGADLKGLGPVPGIAGRSPSYLVRQMYDMQQGTRKGAWTELMKPVVNGLSQEDMLNIAAYASSRTP